MNVSIVTVIVTAAVTATSCTVESTGCRSIFESRCTSCPFMNWFI
jgi:hypothetical protein